MEFSLENTRSFLTEVAGKNLNSVNEISGKAKTSLANVTEQAINRIIETTERAKTSLTELENRAVHTIIERTPQAINSITPTTEKAQGRIGEFRNQSIERISQTTKQAQTSLTETTDRAINNFQQISNKAINSVNETAEQAKLSLEEKIDKLETVSNGTNEAVQKAIASSINTWLNSHSIIHWLFNHPLIALGIVLVSIFLILNLLLAIATLVKQAGLSILKSPFIFGQFLVSQITKSSSNTAKQQIISLAPSEVSLDKIDTLESLITRLEELNQEQESILQEIAKIIKLKK